MPSSGMLRCVALVRTDVSEELSTSFIRATRIGELGTTLAVTGNRRTLRRNTEYCHPNEGGTKFLRNVGSYKSHTAENPRRHHSSVYLFDFVCVSCKFNFVGMHISTSAHQHIRGMFSHFFALQDSINKTEQREKKKPSFT
jgi:hypothetical protein